MSVHVFGDESKASGYRLAAVAVQPGELAELRSLVNGFRLPGQRRRHFTAERDGWRKQFIKSLIETRIRAVIYDASAYPAEKIARPAVVGQLADDVIAMGASRWC